ncbi:MAG: hypothetical protein AAF462_10325 [Thermodesulfobacteriota bacterium]
MTKLWLLLVNNKIYCMMVLVLILGAYSCGSDGGDDSNDDSDQDIVSLCIRECVQQTGASEICDTECKCAAEKLSSEYTDEEIQAHVENITQEKIRSAESISILKYALKSCREK